MALNKPFSEASARNQVPIAEVLETYLDAPGRVLEIGSGTGQHAVYLAGRLPQVWWQPTDLAEAIPGIELWLEEAGLSNLAAPRELDVNQSPWPFQGPFDAVFTANTVHFVGWDTVRRLFSGAESVLVPKGQLLIYGPFNEDGRYTSSGNRQLDQWLKQRDPKSGIKERQAVIDLAAEFGFRFQQRHGLPANNELLSFTRS